jgi:hypothetical protein
MDKSAEPMRISLDLRRHCIETEIRRIYNRSISEFFKTEESERPALERRIELLEQALKTLDFNFLRSTYPPLAGGAESEVTLGAASEGDLFLILDGEKIGPGDQT